MHPVFALRCFPMPTEAGLQSAGQDACVTTVLSPQGQPVSVPCDLPRCDSPGDQIKGNKVIQALSLLTLWILAIYQLFCKRISDCISYLAYGDFHLCDRLILLSGVCKDLQYQCTPHAAQDFSQNKHWQRDRMSSEQFFLLFPIPPFLGFAEAGQYNKGCENTNALPKPFLQGWVMMDAGPLKSRVHEALLSLWDGDTGRNPLAAGEQR